MHAEVKFLGRFVPSAFHKETIEAEVRPLLPPCCRCDTVGVRVPPSPPPPAPNLEWHQDGGGVAGTTRHIVLWASEDPTYIKTSDGVELRGEPFDLVWIDNDKAFHRQPSDTNEQTRWFLAVRCSGAFF